MSILLTIESQNRRTVTSRVEGFDTARISNYYANPDLDVAGNTIIEYDDSPSGYGQLVVLYGVTETIAYIAAGGQTSANTIFSVKKTFGWSGATSVDFTLPSAVNTTPYNMDLGAIVPAYARILDAKIICTAAGTGAVTLVAGLGITTGTAAIGASATIMALNAISGNMACINTPIAISAAAAHVWVSDITPGANWSLMSAGTWEVFVTYNDASSL